MGFLSDTFGASRRFRILAVNDDCCCEIFCLIADTSILGARVARELDAFIGSLNGSFRDKLLNEEMFDSLEDARRKLALWRYDYNHIRPHSSRGNQTPVEARRTLEQLEGSVLGAFAQTDDEDYENQIRKLWL